MKAAPIMLILAFVASPAHAGHPDQARSFPPGTDVLVGLDLEAVRTSPLWKVLKEHNEIHIESEDLQQARMLLGVDLEKDVHRITMGFSVRDDEDQPVEEWLAVIEGDLKRFKPETARSVLEKEEKDLKLTTRKIHGVTVHTADIPEEKMVVGLARLSDTRVVVGSESYLRSYLAARAGKAKALGTRSGLGRVIGDVPQDATFWIAARPEHLASQMDKHKNEKELRYLAEIQELLITGRMDKDLKLTLTARTKDDQTAILLGDASRGLVALARLLPHEEPRLRQLADTVKVKVGDRQVSMDATVQGEWLEEEACCPRNDKKGKRN
jgi:hypothetical protein